MKQAIIRSRAPIIKWNGRELPQDMVDAREKLAEERALAEITQALIQLELTENDAKQCTAALASQGFDSLKKLTKVSEASLAECGIKGYSRDTVLELKSNQVAAAANLVAEEAKERAEEAEERAAVADERAEEAEERAAVADERAEEAEERAEEAEERAEEAEERAEEAEERAAVADARAAAAEERHASELETAKRQVSELRATKTNVCERLTETTFAKERLAKELADVQRQVEADVAKERAAAELHAKELTRDNNNALEQLAQERLAVERLSEELATAAEELLVYQRQAEELTAAKLALPPGLLEVTQALTNLELEEEEAGACVVALARRGFTSLKRLAKLQESDLVDCGVTGFQKHTVLELQASLCACSPITQQQEQLTVGALWKAVWDVVLMMWAMILSMGRRGGNGGRV